MRDIRFREASYIDDPELSEYLGDLGNRLTRVSGARQDFEFFVLRDPTINAFALPGGFVGVHTGLINSADTESELASVLSHEIAHVTQRHIARMFGQQQQMQLPLMAALAAAILLGRSRPDLGTGAAAALQAGAVQTQLSYSRDYEREADRVGIQGLEAAGFDTRAMAVFFEKLQRSSRVSDDGSVPVPADNGGYFDQAVHDDAPNFRRHAIDALEQMGISVEFSHHEGGPGQQEIDLRYADALSMADNVMTFRYVVKEVALADGVRASFMPKPFAEHPGSAMHTHISLFEGESNAFHSPDDPLQLSDVGKSFIAGILEHANEISAVTNQWVNSYKRLVHGGEAPTAASWGAANRSALVRVPMYTPRKASSRRVEVRSPDSACNPYLTFAVLLAAGLRGIEKGYVLGPQAEDNVWSLTPEERRSMGYKELPTSLGVALTEMENSELVAEALGEHVFDFFLRNKRTEWENYRSHVTPFELKTYLSL